MGFGIGWTILLNSEDYIQPTFWWISKKRIASHLSLYFKSLPVEQENFANSANIKVYKNV